MFGVQFFMTRWMKLNTGQYKEEVNNRLKKCKISAENHKQTARATME